MASGTSVLGGTVFEALIFGGIVVGARNAIAVCKSAQAGAIC